MPIPIADAAESPPVWCWALLAPSLLVFPMVITRGFVPEGPRAFPWRPPRGGDSGPVLIGAVIVVFLLHLVIAGAARALLDIPFLSGSIRLGGTVALANSASAVATLCIAGLVGLGGEELGLVRPRRPRNAAATLLALLAFLPLVQVADWLWLELLEWLGRAPSIQSALALYLRSRAGEDRLGAILLAFGAMGAAPVLEELLFRGFLFGALRRVAGDGIALLLASLTFAIFHEPEVMLPVGLVGAALNLIYLRSGSLAYPILFHALFNATTLIRFEWSSAS